MFAVNGGDATSPEQRELCFTVGAVQMLRTQLALQPLSGDGTGPPLQWIHLSMIPMRFSLIVSPSGKRCYLSPESLRVSNLSKHSNGGKTEPNLGKTQNSVLRF